jgi:sulfite reductase (NADPH) flavoprotein alpha-component
VSRSNLQPKAVPFAGDDFAVLDGIIRRSSPQQRSWLAGYLAGLEAQPLATALPAQAPRSRAPLLVLYASESGNAEGLALKAKKAADKAGFQARVRDMADATLDEIAAARMVIVYAATWGEGDPPARAADLYAALMSDSAPRLDGVRFAVLGLGDRAYVNFCLTAKRIDERLAALGGIRAAERADLDVDFAKAAAEWTGRALDVLAPATAAENVVRVDFAPHGDADAEDAPGSSAETAVAAEITALVDLNGRGSSRETWHVELAPEAQGLRYAPGDAIGVLAENDPAVVGGVLEAAGLGGNAALAAELVAGRDVTTLSPAFIEKFVALTGREDALRLAAPEAFKAYAAERRLVDFLRDHREILSADGLRDLLRPLPPRLYSVASSPAAHGDEVHLLVGAVRWQAQGEKRGGVASTFVADRRRPGQSLRIFVKPNRHFRLPAAPEAPIVMIGAGTGVAPYRAFVAERAATGAAGRSWLVFGERNYTNDFLYQTEWQDHLASGALSRLDVAFSRDQPEKIYVQHRLWAERDALRGWLADGAHLYVCGDEKWMARDVDETLVRILAEPHGGDADGGRAALKALAKDGRYQRDVY